MAASRVENPDEIRTIRDVVGPPIEAAALVEASHGVLPREMSPVSKQLMNNSNAAIGNLLKRSLASCMRLAKTSFGSVAKVFSVFDRLKRIMGGI
ncbi:MAG: hypothetical protein V1744_01865 [Candidatus Altiarchaeota archaeon]